MADEETRKDPRFPAWHQRNLPTPEPTEPESEKPV